MLLLSYNNKGILSCPTFDILWNLSLWYLPLSILVTASGTTRARKGRKDMMAARDMNWVMRSTHSYTWLYTKFDNVSHKIWKKKVVRHRLKLLLLCVHLLPGGDCEHGVEDGHVQLVAHGNGLADLGKKREKNS